MYTQFSGITFGVHGCGTGGEVSILWARFVYVLVRGGRLSTSGNLCVDVYPPRGISIEAVGVVEAGLEARIGPGSRWGIVGPMWGVIPIAGT